MRKHLGLAALLVFIGFTFAAPSQAIVAVDEPLTSIRIDGADAEKIYNAMATVPVEADYEDGLLPAIYQIRTGKNVRCVRSVIIQNDNWSHTCFLRVSSEGRVSKE